MIASTSHQAWLFYSPLARQAVLLKDDLLDPVDQLLDDPALVDLVRQCLAARSPLSTRTGRSGMAPDRLLRCCVMKHLKGWSFRDLERELRSNLVYRRFTRFDAEATPDHTVFSRTFALLSPQITEKIHHLPAYPTHASVDKALGGLLARFDACSSRRRGIRR
jgi:Transposase domain (DUF772)